MRNIGLGIGYEMVLQEMWPDFTKGVAEGYSKCLFFQGTNLDSRVKPCIVYTMRKAVERFGLAKVAQAAEQQAPSTATALINRVKPAFVECVSKAEDRKAFNECADLLTISAGAEISSEAVNTNAQVLLHFPQASERKVVAQTARNVFTSCMEEEKKTPRSGNLSTDSCVLRVKLETARAVAHALFASNLKKQGLPTPTTKKIQSQVSRALDSCWNSTGTLERNNECMRGAVETLVTLVAETKLTSEIPASLTKREPKLRQQLVDSVRACIKNNLPKNLMESTASAKKVEDCAASLLKSAAIKVAAHEIEEVLRGKTTDLKSAGLVVKNLVHKNFSACLGPLPDEKRLAKCSASLKRLAGVEVARLLFKEEIEKFVRENGGLRSFGISQEDQNSYLAELLEKHTKCLVGKVQEDKPEQADAAVDICFKNSIQSLATYLARLVFQKKLKENLPDSKSGAIISEKFVRDFNSCLKEKEEPAHTVNAYVANISNCSARLRNPYTLEIGKIQLDAALEQNLKGEDLQEERQRIKSEVLNALSSCIEKLTADDENGRDKCVNQTKKQATLAIAIEATREQTRTFLRVLDLPKEIEALERTLAKCLEQQNADLCAKEHAQAVAKALGSIKIRSTLADALGEKGFSEIKNELTKAEVAYFSCVDKIPGRKIHDDFIRQLEACGATLEAGGIALVQQHLSVRMERPGESKEEQRIKAEIAIVMPCLDDLLPQSPMKEFAISQIDPEGLLLPIARMIADYVNFDSENADKDFNSILKQLERDLAAAGPKEARVRLLDLLLSSGMLDRMLRSMALSEVRKSLDELPAEDKLPEALKKVLLDKLTIESALNSEAMDKIRPLLTEKILKPVLIDGRSLTDPAQKAAIKILEAEIAGALLDSSQFGSSLVSGAVQKQIDAESRGSLSRWLFTKVGFSYDWDKLRQTEAGRQAEKYVKEQMIRPRITGVNLSADEMAKRKKEAARLIKEAVKKQ